MSPRGEATSLGGVPAPDPHHGAGDAEPQDTRLRVLWLIKGLGRGGAEHLLLRSLSYVDTTRFYVEIAYLLPWKDALVPPIEANGTTVHCLHGGRPLDLRWLVRMRALVRSRRFELVHTHMPYPAIGARVSLPRTPMIVHTEHNVWPRYRWASRIANRLTINRNQAVIAVSEAVAETIRPPFWRRKRVPVRVVLHGVDLPTGSGAARRAASRRALGLSSDARVLGTVGSLTPKKDHVALLTSFASVRREVPGAKLVVIGDGPLRQKLQALSEELGVDADVIFTGTRDDVVQLLPAFDIFVLSSVHEGLPIALLEALAAGLPCVCTSVGGIEEVVRDGVEGFLTESGDTDGLTRTILKLFHDETLRSEMASRAVERAAAFDMRRAVADIERLYEDVLAGRA